MDVESLAVAAITTAIARCDLLDPIIEANDKTPFTDGHIDVYSGRPLSKKTWEGRVPVQVKGRQRQSRKPVREFGVPRVDLVAFEKESGVLYFLVTVDQTGMRVIAYYAILSSSKIRSLLEDSPHRESVKVKFKSLPAGNEAVERVVRFALKTRENHSSVDFSSILLERAESFELHLLEDFDTDRPLTLDPTETDFVVVAKTSDGLSVLLDGGLQLFPEAYVPARRDVRIASGEVEFTSCIVKKLDDERVEAKLTEGLTLTFAARDGAVTTGVALSLDDDFDARVKSISFYLALIDTKAVTIGESSSPIQIEEDPDDSWLRQHLRELREQEELFAKMRIDTRLVDLSAIDEARARQLRTLHRALVRGEEVGLSGAQPTIGILPIGSCRILVIVMKGTEEGKWQLTDPFDEETRGYVYSVADDPKDAGSVPVTAYELAERNTTSTVLNLNLENIVSAYDAIATAETTIGIANQQVLTLLRAADDSDVRRSDFLQAAERLNDWLVQQEGVRPRNLVNGWQIVRRGRDLTADEVEDVRELRREARGSAMEQAQEVELACSLLLGDHPEVDHLIARMPREMVDEIQQWPIWALRDG